MKPTALSMVEAASIPLVGLTAWQALIERANLRPGQKVVIHAGSGDVGKTRIHDRANDSGIDEGRDFGQLSAVRPHEQKRIVRLRVD